MHHLAPLNIGERANEFVFGAIPGQYTELYFGCYWAQNLLVQAINAGA